jgi:Rieske Fe-S protein
MERRGFFKKLASGVIGFVLGLVPIGSGIGFLLDPLRRRSQQNGFVRVTSVDTLPTGVPRRFTVTATKVDAWNRSPDEPIGAVYLVRRGEREVSAYQVICPHAGCSVDYRRDQKQFHCPCHQSSFNLDGSIASPENPAARGMDELEVKLEGQDVLVHYQEFQPGTSKKIALS